MENKKKNNEASWCSYGLRHLIGQLEILENHLLGAVNNNDPEDVHKLRVTSRRIREIIAIFQDCFPKKDHKRWNQQIKTITRCLGTTRDLDVHIFFLQQEIKRKKNKDKNKGLNYLLSHYQKRRECIQKDVVSMVTDLKDSSILQEMIQYSQNNIEEHKKIPETVSEVIKTFDTASNHIQKRIQSLLNIQDSAYREEEKKKHHELRIQAKKLRYSLEIFSDLYPMDLTKEITSLKTFQDLLGSIHDYDVWTETLDRLIEKMKKNKKDQADLIQSLDLFREYIIQKRKETYTRFVTKWEEHKEKGFFATLQEKISTIPLSSDQVPQIAVISSVHGNIHALQTALEDINAKNIPLILNLGNSIGYGAYPEECVQRLAQPDILSIMGNVEREVLSTTKNKNLHPVQRKSIVFTKKQLSKQSKYYLSTLPLERRIAFDNKTIVLIHGDPVSLQNPEYPLESDEHLLDLSIQKKSDILLLGHIHHSFHRTLDNHIIINNGSIGRYEPDAHLTSYTVIRTSDLSFTQETIPYPRDDAVEGIRDALLPEEIAQMIVSGRSLDHILKEDDIIKTSQDEDEIFHHLLTIANEYDPDVTHSQQVTKLALDIFDKTKDIHHLKDKDRLILTSAALLHDIGWSKGSRSHHKSSLKMIMNHQMLPVTITQRCMIANIARYHRKQVPTESHPDFQRLSSSQRYTVRFLSSILRVADGLDASHGIRVSDIKIEIKAKKIELLVTINGDFREEERSVERKKDLFEEMFQRKLVVSWKQRT
jgi:CHAD domain-containing protein/predicted phosphodiesterase